MQVDPENRLVAEQLEAEWNEGLRGFPDGPRSSDPVQGITVSRRSRVSDRR
jgi:hypothetical protein